MNQTSNKKMIVALNNPGVKYDSTPHNVGKVFLDWLCEKLQQDNKIDSSYKWKDDKKMNAKILELKIGNREVVFVLPKTFMNESGIAVAKVINYYKIDLKKLIVIHDEADMLIGKSKLGFSHSSAGHRGIESVIQYIKSQFFWRYRIGIRPVDIVETKYKFKAGDFVLQKMSKENQKVLFDNFEKFYLDIMRWIINT